MREQLCSRLSFIITEKFAAAEARGAGRGAGLETRGMRVDNSAGTYNADDRKRLPAEPHKLWKAGCSAVHPQHERPGSLPLLQAATVTLNRQLKSGISDHALAELVISLRRDARLCRVTEDLETTEPQVICSMGLRDGNSSGAGPEDRQ